MLVWRYLTESDIDRQADDRRLQLSRLASFPDAFECRVPLMTSIWREYERVGPRKSIDLERFLTREQIEQSNALHRGWASCWFGDEHESLAMWELYVRDGQSGIAIGVLHQDLCSFASDGVAVWPVQYVRHDDASADVDLARMELWPFYKLWGFRHEAEVRLFVPEHHRRVVEMHESEKWARLADSDVNAIVRHARVMAAHDSDLRRLKAKAAAIFPMATVEETRAYPPVRAGGWLLGTDPSTTFAVRMEGLTIDSRRRPPSADANNVTAQAVDAGA